MSILRTLCRPFRALLPGHSGRRNEAHWRSLMQNSLDVVLIVGPDGTIQYQSPSVEWIFGYAPGQLVGRQLADWAHPDDAPRVAAYLAEAAPKRGLAGPEEWRLRHRDGSWLAVETVGANFGHDPSVRGVVLNIRDVSERKALEAQLTHQAFHDSLTGLPNRALFKDRVEHALARRRRYNGSLGILFLDLDDFKTVNDSLGHSAGDHLLTALAERLASCLRIGDTAARLGGDEFAILLEGAGDPRDASDVAERILAALRAPFEVQEIELFVTASIGIATSDPDHGVDELLRNADVAMYAAKTEGKARYRLFRPAMHEAVLKRLALKADLQRALERQEFSLHYQPMVTLQTGGFAGVEALLRWSHPERGLIGPAEFIPLADETGLIVPIGRWVLQQACTQARAWQDQLASDPPLKISVNISPRQLAEPGLVEDVREALRAAELSPQSLILEIAEGYLMPDVDVMIDRLGQLKELGVGLAVDDFGTGYTSLSSLRRLPIDVLKIDKLFIEGIGDGTESGALAGAIIELGRALDLRVSAEGIELSDQLERLRLMGCELGQGYYWTRPMPSEATGALLASARAVVLEGQRQGQGDGTARTGGAAA